MLSECPFCHAEFDVDPQKAGEKGVCPTCGKEFAITEEILVEEPAGEGVRTVCPECNQEFEVGQKDIGEGTICPFCHADFTIFSEAEKTVVEEDAGTGMTTHCPGCGAAFEVGAKDIGERAVCPTCGKEFIISAPRKRKTGKLAAWIAGSAAAVLALAAIGIYLGYRTIPNRSRAEAEFAGLVGSRLALRQNFVLTPAVKAEIQAATKQFFAEMDKSELGQTATRLYCDRQVANYTRKLCEISARPDYQRTAEDDARDREFWKYIRYNYQYANRIFRGIDRVAQTVAQKFPAK